MKFKVKLRLIDSSGKKHKYSLNLEEGSKFTLGRGTPGIGAELNHPTVSTAHCHLTISGGVLHVMDNKSRNGTKLNGKPVSNAAVRVGDMVQLGVCQIEFLEAPNPPIEENPQSTTFIDINELSPEEAAALGKGKGIADELRATEPTMAMSKQALSQALADNGPPPTDEPPVDAAPVASVTGQKEEPSRVIDPNAQTQSGVQDTGAYGAPANPYATPTNPYAAPANPYAAPANPYGTAPSVPDRPGSEPRPEDTLGFRPLDSYGRGREGEYRREDDPRYNPDARNRRHNDEDEDRRSSRKSSRRERELTDTGASVKPRKASRSRSGGIETHGLVSTLITLCGTATAGSLVSLQKGNYSPLVTIIAGVVGTILVAFLAWMLRKQNEFMEAEGEAKDYYRFLSYSTVALIPASLLTSSAIIFRLAAFIVLGVAFFHFFMVKFRPVAEKFVFLVGSYVCVVTFLGYMVGGQLSGGQVGPQSKHPRITENQKHVDDDQDREPANDDEEQPPERQQPPQQPPPQPVQQPTQAVNSPPPEPVQTAQPPPQPPQEPSQQQQAANTPPQGQPQKIETPPEKPKNNKPGPDSFAISQLYKAAEHGDVDIVKKLIREKGVNPNTVAENGVTALMLAAYYGHSETAKYLLSENADINLKDRQGTTALMWAVLKGNKDMVLVLVKAGSNLSARRNDGDTALDIARLWHYDDVVRILEDPERAKKGFASNGGGGPRKPSSQPKKQPKKSPGKTKGKSSKKKGKYSATVDDDS